jgi:hypothetical protein
MKQGPSIFETFIGIEYVDEGQSGRKVIALISKMQILCWFARGRDFHVSLEEVFFCLRKVTKNGHFTV